MSRDPGLKFQKFFFFAHVYIKFQESYQICGKLAQEQNVTGKKQIGGGNPPPPPSVLIGSEARDF